jgi:hypothetical protein
MIGEDEARGRGFGVESTRFIVRYAFEKLKLHRLGLGVYRENKIAIACYKEAGFKIEGTEPDSDFFAGQYDDLVLMALLNKN